jgi:hypothetical protein
LCFGIPLVSWTSLARVKSPARDVPAIKVAGTLIPLKKPMAAALAAALAAGSKRVTTAVAAAS